MKKLKLYGSIAVLSVILAVGVPYKTVYATEMGTVTSLSERVYENMDVNSNVVGNVIMGSTFSLVAAEFDAAGNVWYLIETDMGVQGYVMATNVINVKDLEVTASQEIIPEAQPENNVDEIVDIEEDNTNLNENINDSSKILMAKIIKTVQTVNIRADASTEENIMGKIPQDVTLDCIGIKENDIGEIWYKVIYSGIEGYIRESTVEIIEISSAEDETEQSDNTEVFYENEEISQIEESIVEEVEEIEQTQVVEEQDVRESNDNNEFVIQEKNIKSVKKPKGFRVDGIVVFTTLGSLVCIVMICYLIKKIKRICRRK